jgi:ParB-like chromosome segregation protein Spo0J
VRLRVIPDIVAEYAEAMQAGDAFPPVVVFYDGETYWMADGHHRGEAAKQVGHTTIRAEVREGDEREARFYAAGANRTHGLRRDLRDKERAVRVLLGDEEWRQWSDREIARHCGVSHPLVGKLRRQMLTGNVSSERTYRTKYGTVTTMDTTHIGTRPATEEALGDDEVEPHDMGQADRLRGGPCPLK